MGNASRKGQKDNKVSENNLKEKKARTDSKFDSKIYSNFLRESELIKAFETFSIAGKYLTKDKFNECISSLFKFNIPQLAYTFLSECLYSLMDKNNTAKVELQDFLDGMSLVFSNLQKENSNTIFYELVIIKVIGGPNCESLRYEDIFIYLKNCWGYAFMFFFHLIQSNLKEWEENGFSIPTYENLISLIGKNETNLKSYVTNTLTKAGVIDMNSAIDGASLSNWLEMDHTIEICYYKTFRFAVTLKCIEHVGLYFNNKELH